MALTFLQAAANNAGISSPHAAVFGSNNTNNSFLICSILLASSGAAAQLTGVSDPTNGAWTHLPACDTVFSGSRVYVYYVAKNTATTALTVSFTFTGTATLISMGIAEYSNQSTTFGPIDAGAVATDGTGTSYSGTAIVTASTNETVIGFGYTGVVSGSITGTNGFTSRLTPNVGSALLDAAEATNGSYTPTCTISGVGGELTLASIAVFSTTTQQAATPTFSPNGGAFGPAQTVTITSTASSTIYYTTDGSTPTHASPSIMSGGTVSISVTSTLKAIGSISGLVDSAVGSASFTINGAVTTSTFSPGAGSYTATQHVTVSNADSALSGFAQYYTLDGTNPTTGSPPVSGAITITATKTLKVLAVATGYSNSAIASALYTIGGVTRSTRSK